MLGLKDQISRWIPELAHIADQIKRTGNPNQIFSVGFRKGLFQRRNRVRLNTNIKARRKLGSFLRQNLRVNWLPTFFYAKRSCDQNGSVGKNAGENIID